MGLPVDQSIQNGNFLESFLWRIKWLFHWTIFLEWSCYGKGKKHLLHQQSSLYCQRVNIYLPFTIHPRKPGALCLRNGVSNIRNGKTETRGESGRLAAYFFGLKYIMLEDWISECLRTPRNGIYSLCNEISPILFPWRKEIWCSQRRMGHGVGWPIRPPTPPPPPASEFGQLSFFGLPEKFGQRKFCVCVCVCARVRA